MFWVVTEVFDPGRPINGRPRGAATPTRGTGGGEGAVASTLSWCGDALARFTGEADNAVLAEYVVAMESAEEARVFLEESFGDAEAAAAFAAELEKVARGEG